MTQWKNFSDERPPLDVQLRLEVKEKDRNTDTPEPYFGKPLFKGYAVFEEALQKYPEQSFAQKFSLCNRQKFSGHKIKEGF